MQGRQADSSTSMVIPFAVAGFLNRAERDEGQYNNQSDIFWSSGACMIVRRDMWIKCGGFDSDFFAHMEEIDLCWRFSKAGYVSFSFPDSSVYHIGGGSLQYDSPFKISLTSGIACICFIRIFLVTDSPWSCLSGKSWMDLLPLCFLARANSAISVPYSGLISATTKSGGKLREKREAVKRLGDDHAR